MSEILAKIAPHSLLSQYYPPCNKFDVERDVPDLTGKVFLVTGGNNGLGYLTIRSLLLKNAKVYLAGRSPMKCEEAARCLREDTGREPIVLRLDLADLSGVRKAAEEFLGQEERLDVLYNNAGIMIPPMDLLTAQGYDLRTNVLGHYFFTILLLPALERSTIHHKVKARVINLSSVLHEISPGPEGIEWELLKGGAKRDNALTKLYLPRWRLYGISKMGNILLSNILTRYYGNIIVSCSVHPGVFKTDLHQHVSPVEQICIGAILYPLQLGHITPMWAGTVLKPEALDGKYLIPWARFGKPNPRTEDEKTQAQLKMWLEEQVKGY